MFRSIFYILILIPSFYCGACGTTGSSPQNPSNSPSEGSSGTNDGPSTASLPPPAFPEQGSPTLLENFTAASTNFNYKQSIPDGIIQFGISNPEAEDGKIVQLTIPGHPEYNAHDFTSPPGVQIKSSPVFTFGTFRTRLRASACAENNEGVIYGIFTYWNEGLDLNDNNIIDNQEIDIEISCDSPHTLFLTLWTDYSDDSHFLKVTRKINLMNGSYTQTLSGEENTWELNASGQLSSWPSTQTVGQWLDMGFTWTATKVEFFLYQNNTRYVLWTYQNTEHIPQHAAPFLFNIWHTPSLWSNGGLADYPSEMVFLQIDSFAYFAH